MPANVDYFYTLASPWSYLGHAELKRICARQNATIIYRPYLINDIFANSGAVHVSQRPMARRYYRMVELQRWREKRDTPLNLTPGFFPVDPSLADACTGAIVSEGKDPFDFMLSMYQDVWVNERDISNRAVISDGLRENGFDPDAIIELAQSAQVKTLLNDNSEMAIASNVVGAPGYVLNGEPFWGQDRLALLEDALASGRKPFPEIGDGL